MSVAGSASELPQEGAASLAARVASLPPERRALLERVLRSQGTDAGLPLARREPTGAPVPLALNQRSLWFLDQLGELGTAYHIPIIIRLGGVFDRVALGRALDHLLERHEALRTTFHAADEEPVQRFTPTAAAPFCLVEYSVAEAARVDRSGAVQELRRLLAEELETPFDLTRGPLVRGRLIQLHAKMHLLVVTMHHIVSDGWSVSIFVRELTALYRAFQRGEPDPLPPLAIHFADYAIWQRRRMTGPVLERQGAYWERTLAGAPEVLALPTDHPRPARRDFTGASLAVELDETLTAGLKSLSQRHGTTLFVTLLAGWAIVLSRMSGQQELVIGAPTANRSRPELEGLIGFFANMLALRVDLRGEPTVDELLQRVKGRALEAQEHQDIAFEQVVQRLRPTRSLSHAPIVQAVLVWQNTPDAHPELPGLRKLLQGAADASDRSRGDDPAPQSATQFDLTLILGEHGRGICGKLQYMSALFDRPTVERHVGYLVRVLRAMMASDSQYVGTLPLLGTAERRQIVEGWNATTPFPGDACLHELIEVQVARAADASALVFDGKEGSESMSYAALEARANQLARHLRTLGVGPDSRVALCLHRSLELVVALAAVLKAGGAYVPLDASYPVERLQLMVGDSRPLAVVTEAALAERVAGAGVPLLVLDAPDSPWTTESAAPLSRGALTPAHLAYVIYTSGSTGQPKGVGVPHANAARLFASTAAWFAFNPADVWTLFHSAAFDFSVWELWGALVHGGRLVVLSAAVVQAPAAFVDVLARERVTVLNQTPSAFRGVLAELSAERVHEPLALRHVVFGGEALEVGQLAPWYDEWNGAGRVTQLTNMYGITETTVHATYRPLSEADMRRRGASPIGVRLPDLRLYVLDRAGEPVPVGVAGELTVGGAGLARGYHARAGLTAERFVPDSFGLGGGRLYRSGDLARWRTDGELEYLGRADAQVKVRGYRIELGEIEAVLGAQPDVRQAVVLAREDRAGDTRLVAYYVAAAPLDVARMRAGLSEQLPEYMVPAAYVRMEALPVTASGKVDRQALPAPEADAYAHRGYEAPLTPTEVALAAVWAELLGVEQVGRSDEFFALGGHSLLAVQMVTRVRQLLGREVVLTELFARPALADFARLLDGAAHAALPAIAPAPPEGRRGLSFAQQRLWFLEQLGGQGPAYHVGMRVRLSGGLDRGALRRALDRIVERHEVLRTTFSGQDGLAVQVIAPAERSVFALVEEDLTTHAAPESALRRLVAEEAAAPFDLTRGPLIRGRLIRGTETEHVLLVTMHHIVSDGWSNSVLLRELNVLYGAFQRGEADPLPALAIQYADYAAWQRQWVSGAVLQTQASYWRAMLAGAPEVLDLPTDRPRSARPDAAGLALPVVVEAELAAGLKALARRERTTLFHVLLAGWAAVLSRVSGQQDVVIGTPTANRGRAELEGLIGFFVNTLALRIDLTGEPTVAELVQRVKTRALEAQQHQDIPFEQVVELVQPARSLAHTPLFQVMFAWQNAPNTELELSGVRRRAVPATGRTAGTEVGEAEAARAIKFDLTLTLMETGREIRGSLEYATALFERGTVERHAGYLRRVFEQMAADAGQGVAALPLLSEGERRLVVETWNATAAPYRSDVCIHELFEGQAARTPDVVAAIFGEQQLTYAELNARANQLAHYLRAAGVGPDARVALCVERSMALIIALLGILKAGGAYVPLDPGYPADRLRFLLSDSAPVVIITQTRVAALMASAASDEGVRAPIVVLDEAHPPWDSAPTTSPSPGDLTSDNLAYVIYTSGSTGRPKGVAVEHRGVVNLLPWMHETYGLEPHESVLLKATINFDASVWECFWPLMVGARVVIAPPDGHKDPADLIDVIRRQRIGTVHFIPSLLQLFLEHPALTKTGRTTVGGGSVAADLRQMICGGEALPVAVLQRARERFADVKIYNFYGPTETSVGVTSWRAPAATVAQRVPIGTPVANTRAYVLDSYGEPSPVAVGGELYIGGTQVVRGYLGRAALTADRFVPDPFGRPGTRLYRTGDQARWLADGTLEFRGRNDLQVKVRGYRIELEEIEARLLEYPGIRECAVVARQDASADVRLVAYCVGDTPPDGLPAHALRAHLASRLPEYMIPAAYVRIDALPLGANGKLDRGALPAAHVDRAPSVPYAAPRNTTELRLAAIWRDLLQVDQVGIDDNFFELGGHSLMALRVIARVREQFDVALPLRSLFEAPTIAGLAIAVVEQRAAMADAGALHAALAEIEALPARLPSG